MAGPSNFDFESFKKELLTLAIINLDFDINKLNFENLTCLFHMSRNLIIHHDLSSLTESTKYSHYNIFQ